MPNINGTIWEGVGIKNGATVSVVEKGNAVVHQTILTLTATPVTITDDAGVAQYGGTAKLYDFPDGAILIQGAVINGNLTLGTTGTIINTYTGDNALGSATATTGATLTGTEADILASTANTIATAKVAPIKSISLVSPLVYDGTTTALDLYLNFAIADDVTHTSGTGTFTGTITVTWANLGDK